jgi:hypothetical protein
MINCVRYVWCRELQLETYSFELLFIHYYDVTLLASSAARSLYSLRGFSQPSGGLLSGQGRMEGGGVPVRGRYISVDATACRAPRVKI